MFKKHLAFLAVISLAGLISATNNPAIITVDEVKPGMKGYGLTVFQGTEPERFDVEVVGVLKKAMPKQDMILVRLSGHDLENSGIYKGMSGSPIFINDRIMGALAYGWEFSKIPLTGITPIENMLAELKRPLETAIPVASAPIGGGSYSYQDGQLVPVATPVMVSGFPPTQMRELAEAFKPYNLIPIQGGGGAAQDEKTSELKPGSAVGVSIIRGDISMTAIGTVTWVEGSRVLAFGHPFLFGGEIGFPMTGAKIIALLPRSDISTKMGIMTNEMGTLIQDRQSCVIGDLNSRVKMVPFDINVKNGRSGRQESIHTEVAWEPGFTMMLMTQVLQMGLMYIEANAGENTADAVVEVKFKGYPPVTLKNTYFNSKGPFHRAMLEPLIRMVFNPFEKVELESVKFSTEITPEIRIATIKRMWMEENEIEPGGVGHLHVVLSPLGLGEVEKVVEVPISEDYEPGTKLMIGAAGGSVVVPPVAPPMDFRGVIKLFESLYNSTDLVVVQQMATTGARVEGAFMPD